MLRFIAKINLDKNYSLEMDSQISEANLNMLTPVESRYQTLKSLQSWFHMINLDKL